MKTINIGDLYRSAGAFTGYGDLGRGWRFEMNAKVHNKNYRQPTIRQKNNEYAVAGYGLLFRRFCLKSRCLRERKWIGKEQSK